MFFRRSSPSSNETFHLKASQPFEEKFDLSPADNIPPAINSRYIFIYDTRGETRDPKVYRNELVDRLKKSLQSFLRLPEDNALAFPQLLGKVYIKPDNGRLFVHVKKSSSLPFVVATHDKITIESLRPELGFPSQYLDPKVFATGVEAVPRPDSDGGWDTFQVQTTFIAGGYVIMVNKHHYLLDATATGFLMKSWFERARLYASGAVSADTQLAVEREGKAKKIHDNTSLMTLKEAVPKQDTSLEWTIKPGASAHIFGLQLPPASVMFVAKALAFVKPKIDNAIFHFSPAALRELHGALQAESPLRISTHDAVCALVWRCIARARLNAAKPKDKPAACKFSLAVNGRGKLEPPLADGYFGNAAFFSTAALDADVFCKSDQKSLASVAGAIRENLNVKTTDAFLRAQLELVVSQPKATDVVNAWNCYMGYDVLATSWERSFGSMDDVDLKCGRFQRMRLPGGGQFDGLICVLPAFGLRDKTVEDAMGYPGGLEVAVDLFHAHLDALKQDAELKQYATCLE
ncbi:transferase family-domain-containing protein [Macrophomina phaseolina]|uniref:Transferase family-domain-containing protein n=1 Tax=Macrophomina phaseolina TaxID=35725 RepID=A0ABQ8FPY1_9PEZI|nr:transferase family-domain-containing protein [Macrophomina phaseolina]